MTNQQQAEHPGGAMARREIEAFYQQHLRAAGAAVQRATADAVIALAGQADTAQAQRSLESAQRELAEYEAGHQQWTETGTMPWRHSETVSRVIGSIEGGLDAAFGPPVELTEGEAAALETGLDPALEPDGNLAPTLDAALGALSGEQGEPNASMTAWEDANRQYQARNELGREAMEHMGLYRHGDPATPAMHAEWAAEMIAEDAWRASVGLEPMCADDIREEQQAAGPDALAAYAHEHPEAAAVAQVADAPAGGTSTPQAAAATEQGAQLADALAAGRDAVAQAAGHRERDQAEEQTPDIAAEPQIEIQAPEVGIEEKEAE
jgi:hypothetical protein